ncbi:glycoside hydrolase family 5 protein [Flexithrix dorotheae]|uniref:glycoside hydrolase family 5 protein n=1 Tax=Flexithrix dorotheae TaxID=70993 RepID=UPI00037C62EE|nr:cellulase family glycosylhydrolase [Flexithrix dorotheae]
MEIEKKQNRRDFIKKTGAIAGSIVMGAQLSLAASQPKLTNKLPKWKGFNFLDFFSPDPNKGRGKSKEEYFKWMSDWGFDFVRLPMAYPYYVKFDREKPITTSRIRKFDKKRVEEIEELVYLAHKYNLHVSLNLHRAPGFCVNAGFQEPYNLWTSEEAMEDFAYHWKFWAKRFKNVSREKISFDLLNEPCVREDMNDQHSKRSAIPGDQYRKLALMASKAIRSANPDHLIIADGNNVGRDVIPEIMDLDIGQSCRGYNPAIISHYKASWVYKDSSNLPEPKWPGQVGDQYLSKAMLEEMYKPWIELVQKGVGVHCGECGAYNKTPHDVFLAWFSDVTDVLTENGIGFALWEFKGSFGILDSGREDVDYEDWYGHKLDRKLLDMLMSK